MSHKLRRAREEQSAAARRFAARGLCIPLAVLGGKAWRRCAADVQRSTGQNMHITAFFAFIGVVLIQVFAECAAMARTRTLWRKHKPEWTYYTVAIPFKGMIAVSLIEHVSCQTQPSLAAVVAGCFLAAAGIIIRVWGHLELDGAFSQYVEKRDGQKLVRSGIYARIRHPMYVGSIFLFIGMPLVVTATWAWVFSCCGIVGIFLRIRKEEAFLAAKLPGYKEYMQNTWRLLPFIY